MSFHRDKNAYTRGPGAIASLDRDPARRARRARELAAFEEDDAFLSGLTFGPQGGMGAMMDPPGETTPGKGAQDPPPKPWYKNLQTSSSIPRTQQNLKEGPAVAPMNQPPVIVVDPIKGNPVIVKPPRPPRPKTPTVSTSSGSGAGIVTGGTGGKGGTGGAGAPGIVVAPAMPDAVDVSVEPSNTNKLLLLAAVLGGAWLLLRDGDT